MTGDAAGADPADESSYLRLLRELCNRADQPADWQIEETPGGVWLRVRSGHANLPPQGWKLHVSAGVSSAERILRRAVPILLAENASFKVAASSAVLAELNNGGGAAIAQIGKFVTVYPRDDEQAVRLAAALDRATRGLRGPAIPSDRSLSPGSLVHYRYGSFSDRHVQTPIGRISPAITSPEGVPLPDLRVPYFSPPPWAVDPFRAAGLVSEQPTTHPLVAGRYLLVGTLHVSPRGSVHLGVDLESPRRVVLKRARRDAQLGADGMDARDRLRHEFRVLQRLAADRRFPAPLRLEADADDLLLVMADIEGVPLERWVAARAPRLGGVPADLLRRWGCEFASMLHAVHEAGFVYRDLKSPNIIVAPDGQLHLLDFELAHEHGASAPPFGIGTPGYVSPQQARREPPTVADDIYGLGAILYFIATAAEPSLAPDPSSLLDRPLELLSPGFPHALRRVIARCLEPEPSKRFAAPADVEEALRAAADNGGAVPFGEEPEREAWAIAAERYREFARRLGDSLCAAAVAPPNGEGLAWRTTHDARDGFVSRDLNTGSGGTLLALAELTAAFRQPRHADVLARAARWLSGASPPEGARVAGLYVGEAGIGAALLRAGQVLTNDELIDAAAERGLAIGSLPHTSPDLFNGSAGRLRFHLLVWDETGDQEQLRHATACGDFLLENADLGEGELRWTIPPGFEGLSGNAYLGYAHGAAGIADALLDLYEVREDPRLIDSVQAAAKWLVRASVPVLEDQSGLGWPAIEGGPLRGAFWCHGAAGIGRFFLHAAKLGVVPEAADTAARAARAVARSTRWAGPTQCHGLAGNLEFLLDMFMATGESAYLAEARSLALLLECFAREEEGHVVFPSETPNRCTPDYMVGYAGVAVCLLRLSSAQAMPHQLSREGFRFAPGRASQPLADPVR